MSTRTRTATGARTRTATHAHGHAHAHGHVHDDGHEHAHDEHAPEVVGAARPLPSTTGSAVRTHAPAPPAAPTATHGPTRLVAVEHDHGFGAHTHLLPDPERPLGPRSIAAMGVAGGLVPSPSALVVLLGATALGRAWFGFLLVLAYGAGMALTLTAAGLLLLRARRLLDRPGRRRGAGNRYAGAATGLVRTLPVLTAGVIVTVGVVLAVRGLLLAASVG